MKKKIYIILLIFSFFSFKNNIFAKNNSLTLELECKYEKAFSFNNSENTADIKTNLYCNKAGKCWFKPTEDNAQLFNSIANGGIVGVGYSDHKIINGSDYMGQKDKCPAYMIFQYCVKNANKGFYFAQSSAYDPFGSKANCMTVAVANTYSKNKNESGSSVESVDTSEGVISAPEDVILSFCDETVKIWRLAGYLVTALKIMVPVLIIVMGSIDLARAMLAGSEDEIKKSTSIIVKRAIAGIIIFFIPLIIQLIFSGISSYSNAVSSGSTCINCLTEPGSC